MKVLTNVYSLCLLLAGILGGTRLNQLSQHVLNQLSNYTVLRGN